MKPRSRGTMVRLLSAAVLVAATGACSTGSGAGNDVSVGPGATKQDYIDGFKDVDQITLAWQSPGSAGSPEAKPDEAYAKALEEWSGGKIKFDMYYSGSRVATADMTNGLADGLIDGGLHLPTFDPSSFPVAAFSGDLAFLHEATPVRGALQLNATWVQYGAESEALKQEFEDRGIQPLLPLLPTSGATFFCKDEPVTTVDNAEGRLTRPAGAATAQQVAALGATNVEIATAEVYTAMERGTIDCVASAAASVINAGVMETVDYWTMDPNLMMTAPSSGLSMNKAKWDSLPLVARQLLWDRLDVFIETLVRERQLANQKAAIELADENGVELVAAEQDLVTKNKDFLDGRLEELQKMKLPGADASELVSQAVEISDGWGDKIAGLGFEDAAWQDFADWYTPEKVDLTPFIEEVVDSVLAPNRPN